MSTNETTLIAEIEAVKKLLILQSLAMGYQQKHVAAMLGVSDATLSRMLPKGLPKLSAEKSFTNDRRSGCTNPQGVGDVAQASDL